MNFLRSVGSALGSYGEFIGRYFVFGAVAAVLMLVTIGIGAIIGAGWLISGALIVIGVIVFIGLIIILPVLMLARATIEHISSIRVTLIACTAFLFWVFSLAFYFSFVPVNGFWDIVKVLLISVMLALGYISFGIGISPRIAIGVAYVALIFLTLGFFFPKTRSVLPISIGSVDQKVASQIVPDGTPKRIDPDSYSFFNPVNGKPQVWYYQSPSGQFEFYDKPGYHRTGERLKPITAQVISDWQSLEIEAKKERDNQIKKAEAQRLENERQLRIKNEEDRKRAAGIELQRQIEAKKRDAEKKKISISENYLTKLVGCDRIERNVRCSFIVINLLKERRRLDILIPKSHIIDNSGNEYMGISNNGSGEITFHDIAYNTGIKSTIEFGPIEPSITAFSLIQIKFESLGQGLFQNWVWNSFDFTNIFSTENISQASIELEPISPVSSQLEKSHENRSVTVDNYLVTLRGCQRIVDGAIVRCLFSVTNLETKEREFCLSISKSRILDSSGREYLGERGSVGNKYGVQENFSCGFSTSLHPSVDLLMSLEFDGVDSEIDELSLLQIKYNSGASKVSFENVLIAD